MRPARTELLFERPEESFTRVTLHPRDVATPVEQHEVELLED
jgi:hypothetical protein